MLSRTRPTTLILWSHDLFWSNFKKCIIIEEIWRGILLVTMLRLYLHSPGQIQILTFPSLIKEDSFLSSALSAGLLSPVKLWRKLLVSITPEDMLLKCTNVCINRQLEYYGLSNQPWHRHSLGLIRMPVTIQLRIPPQYLDYVKNNIVLELWENQLCDIITLHMIRGYLICIFHTLKVNFSFPIPQNVDLGNLYFYFAVYEIALRSENRMVL